MEPTLKQIELYKQLRKITEPHWIYADQIMAIAMFISNEFSPKQSVCRMKFKDAPVGARFKYPNMNTIFVKLNSYPKGIFSDGRGLICQWNGNIEGHQSFCSFVDEESGIDFNTVVELV